MKTRVLQTIFAVTLLCSTLIDTSAQDNDYMYFKYANDSEHYWRHEQAAASSTENGDPSLLMNVLKADSVYINCMIDENMAEFWSLARDFSILKKRKNANPADWQELIGETRFKILEMNYFQMQALRERARIRLYKENFQQFHSYYSLMKYMDIHEKELMAGTENENLESLWISKDFENWWTRFTYEWRRIYQKPMPKAIAKLKPFVQEKVMNVTPKTEKDNLLEAIESNDQRLLTETNKPTSYSELEEAFYQVQQTGDTSYVMDAFRQDSRYWNTWIPSYLENMNLMTTQLAASKSDPDYIERTESVIYEFNQIMDFKDLREAEIDAFQKAPQKFQSYFEILHFVFKQPSNKEKNNYTKLWWNIFDASDDPGEHIDKGDSYFEEWWNLFSMAWQQYLNIPFPENMMEWKAFLHDTVRPSQFIEEE